MVLHKIWVNARCSLWMLSNKDVRGSWLAHPNTIPTHVTIECGFLLVVTVVLALVCTYLRRATILELRILASPWYI